MLDLGLRLGEGSGAVAAVPVLRSAVALLRDVALLVGARCPSEPRPDAWRLAAGTLTAIPVPAPAHVDRRTAGRRCCSRRWRCCRSARPSRSSSSGSAELLDLAPLAVAFVALGALAAGSRALHWDGLSDVADGLTASYDRERSLAVMKTGTVGPAGVVATVLVLGVQAAALTPLLASTACLVAGAAVCGSRCALAITCARGVPAARADGLGVGVRRHRAGDRRRR